MEFTKPNLIYKYTPKSNWCHHGYLRTYQGDYGKVIATDTYWGMYSSESRIYNTPPEGSKYLLDLDEFEHKKYINFYDERWMTRTDSDKFYIPIGGGREKFYIRIGSLPNPQLLQEYLEIRINDCNKQVESGKRDLMRYEERLAILKNDI